jgi:branched-chain amino acid aminotransferase
MKPLPHPFDDRDGFMWVDGAFVPWRESTVNILTHGLHYGSAVFEGIRVYEGKPFKLQEHTERLFTSAEILDMKIPFTVEEIFQATLDIVAKQGVINGYIRPIAWRGSEMMAISAQHTKIHVAIATWETKTYFAPELLETGIKLITSKWARPAPNTAPTASKAAGLYMICTMSKHEAERQGYHDALMLDWRGQIAEATGANIFLVQDGALHTPTPDCFLDGITRRTVMKLAQELGYTVVERAMLPEELSTAKTQEVFLTGTAAEITPVGSIDGHVYGVGKVTRHLMEEYSKLARGR